ncbi:hypothetical protein NDU88_001950 [Pleurodeles waltl]|uniref:Uncharacterized protein n=1 Tax=Pleurodeles waltl TaxID=8319 RepID=A0AAV7KU81_PLEWA|nr:hypothetical protein NDU88_001950 [Pleurodeles waltl]
MTSRRLRDEDHVEGNHGTLSGAARTRLLTSEAFWAESTKGGEPAAPVVRTPVVGWCPALENGARAELQAWRSSSGSAGQRGAM